MVTFKGVMRHLLTTTFLVGAAFAAPVEKKKESYVVPFTDGLVVIGPIPEPNNGPSQITITPGTVGPTPNGEIGTPGITVTFPIGTVSPQKPKPINVPNFEPIQSPKPQEPQPGIPGFSPPSGVSLRPSTGSGPLDMEPQRKKTAVH